MASESNFVAIALAAAGRVLTAPLIIAQGRPLLYEVMVDNRLELTVKPKRPVRGDSAFQTDLCVFEKKKDDKGGDIEIPRVVLEFKTRVSTHDVLTYSAKARKHKQVYPSLRYGLVVSDEIYIPRRFFIHNEALDFFAALKNTREPKELERFFAQLLKAEVATSKRMEDITYGGLRPNLFRSEILLD